MHLLVVSQYFWPENFRVNELVSGLRSRGHDVTVLTGKPNYPTGEFFPSFIDDPGRFSTFHGAKVVRVPLVPRGHGKVRLILNYISFAASAAVLGVMRLRSERFDAIVVTQYSPVTVGLPAIALRRLKRLPLAFWVLDQWPESLSAVGVVRSERLLRLVGRLVSFIYSHCDVILSPSRSLIGQIRKYAPETVPVGYFPNWVETSYRVTDAKPAAEVPVMPGAFNVMFAGNIGEAQDFPSLLDAAEQLRGERRIRWLIVGDGRVAEWVRAEIERRELGDVFFLLGRYPADRMPSFFQHASALLVSLKAAPVFAMTAPGKIQSYLAFGLPVIGMLDGEGAMLLREAEAGLTCASGDASGLAEIVLRMANMTAQERAAMGANGAAYAKREFDRERLLDSLLNTLADLTQANTRRAGA